MSQWITDLAELEALYGTAAPASLRKVAPLLTLSYRKWVEISRFCILSTVGPEGTDASPRGDEVPVVRIRDARHLLLPDWHGNNRIDSLRNILRDPRLSLLFMVPGSTNVLRINGRGRISAAADLLGLFERQGKQPRTVLEIEIGEVYFQCARALMRSRLWAGEDLSAALPTAGEMLADVTKGEEGGADYDRVWPERAAKTLW